MFISKLKSFPKYDSFSKFISTRTQSFLNRTINMIAEIAPSFPGCKITLNIAISYRFQASVCSGEIHLSVCCPLKPLFSCTDGYGKSSSRIDRSRRSILRSCWFVAL